MMNILIADDHGVLRAGLRALLEAEEGMRVVAEASDGGEALELARAHEPDLVLLDISMPGRTGIETASDIKGCLPDVHIIILSMHEDADLLQAAIKAGATGYIPKRAVESELINAVHAVQRGELYVHPSMTRSLLTTLQPDDEPSATVEPLTPREIEVLRLIAQGHTNRQIGELLTISVRTVESHRANLTGKLGISSRVALVRYARDRGYIQ
jgi:DNA-binding NarL/FixJ family response regulator